MAGSSNRAAQAARWRPRYAPAPQLTYTSKTKLFFLTSEFLVFVTYLMGLGIGAATSDEIDARLF